jgi:predicted ATPase
MFTSIEFHNLRCFEDFRLDNLTPLTLISGRNNVGKTTILEGIFLLLAYRKADVFLHINNFRGIEFRVPTQQGLPVGLVPRYLWETLFSNMDMEQELSISMTDKQLQIRTLRLAKDEQFSLTTFAEQNKTQSLLQPNFEGYAVKILYTYGSSPTETGSCLPTTTGVALKFDCPPNLSISKFCCYIGPNAHPSQYSVAEWLGEIELGNKKEQLIKNLRLLFDKIEDIFTVQQNGIINIFSRLQNGQSLPIRAMGDGINKLLHYLSVIIANPGGIFLLDEIETGFHYSFYPKLWELISSVAQETNSQIVATTHSYECISAAAEGSAKIDSSLLTYVRLGKEEDAIIPYAFAGDDLAYALEREMEVR